MKVSRSIAGAALVLVLSGCGGGESTPTQTQIDARAQTNARAQSTAGLSAKEREAANAALEAKVGYPVPKAPPRDGKLTKLVVREINEGKGPAAHWGDEVNVRYVARVYQTGKIYAKHWSGVDTFLFNLDGKSFGLGWQRGIEGMRVGGRREILVPSRLLFEDDDVAYMVTMLWLKQM